MYGNEAGVGEAIRPPGSRARSCSSPASSTTASTSPTTARKAFDRTLDGPRPRPGRPVPDPLAAAHAVRRRLRLHLADPDRVPEGRPRPLDRRLQLPARPPRAARAGDRRRAGGQPDRGAPLLHQRGRPRRQPRRRHPGRVVVADRAGRRARRRHHRRDRRAGRPYAGPGDPALARPARRHRLPEVLDPRADGENFALFDFELDDEAMAAITALDRGEDGRTGPNPDTFDYIPD